MLRKGQKAMGFQSLASFDLSNVWKAILFDGLM